MINDYVFRTKGRLPFFLSAPVFTSEELANYSEEEIEKDASMLMILLLNSFHPKVGNKLQEIMLQAGELAAKSEALQAYDQDDSFDAANILELLKQHKKEVAKFFDHLEAMATERLMSLPEEDKPPVT